MSQWVEWKPPAAQKRTVRVLRVVITQGSARDFDGETHWFEVEPSGCLVINEKLGPPGSVDIGPARRVISYSPAGWQSIERIPCPDDNQNPTT